MANESFIRWQGRTLEQFSYVNNLFVGLATGLLGFLAIEDGSTDLAGWQRLAAVGLGTSILVGSALAITRLLAFRTTKNVARKREGSRRHGIEDDRALAEKLGRASWILLYIQLFTFVLGAISTSIPLVS